MKIKKILKRNDKIKKQIKQNNETIEILIKVNSKLINDIITPCEFCTKNEQNDEEYSDVFCDMCSSKLFKYFRMAKNDNSKKE